MLYIEPKNNEVGFDNYFLSVTKFGIVKILKY